MFRVAGAFVFGSFTFSISPMWYFAQTASFSSNGIAKCRKTETAVMSASVTFVASFVLSMKFSGNAAPQPSLGLVLSKTWRYLPLIFATHASEGGAVIDRTSALAVENRPTRR